jgi:hypothetical protein
VVATLSTSGDGPSCSVQPTTVMSNITTNIIEAILGKIPFIAKFLSSLKTFYKTRITKVLNILLPPFINLDSANARRVIRKKQAGIKKHRHKNGAVQKPSFIFPPFQAREA